MGKGWCVYAFEGPLEEDVVLAVEVGEDSVRVLEATVRPRTVVPQGGRRGGHIDDPAGSDRRSSTGRDSTQHRIFFGWERWPRSCRYANRQKNNT